MEALSLSLELVVTKAGNEIYIYLIIKAQYIFVSEGSNYWEWEREEHTTDEAHLGTRLSHLGILCRGHKCPIISGSRATVYSHSVRTGLFKSVTKGFKLKLAEDASSESIYF